ncbi:MAG: PGF-pre-PGF domain-containing protein [Candidatus Aenigmatarchaeota archaeon]
MKKAITLFVLLFLTNIAKGVDFEVLVFPNSINASQEVLLSFNVTNLDSESNITTLDIFLPSVFEIRSFSPLNFCRRISILSIRCENFPLISALSSFFVNVSGIPNIDFPGVYSFDFRSIDDRNINSSVSVNITIQDVSPPLIFSISPLNNTLFEYSEGREYYFVVDVFDDVMVNSSELFLGGELKAINYTKIKSGKINIVLKDLPSGEFNFSFRINDSSRNFNSSLPYYFKINKAINYIDVFFNETKNQNVTVINGSIVNITVISKGNISGYINDTLLFFQENVAHTVFLFDKIGMHKLYFNSSGNQNYTQNSSGIVFWVKVIYPRLSYSILEKPSIEYYSPEKIYNFKILLSSPSFPFNNITNASFYFNGTTTYFQVTNHKEQTFSISFKDLRVGEYEWIFCGLDSQSEEVCTGGVLKIEKAVPKLEIFNAQDYLAPVNKTIVGLNCPDQLICKFYLNESELSKNYYVLATEKGGVYVFIFNTSGNENYTSYEIKKIVRVYEEKKSEEKQTTTTLILEKKNYSEEKKLVDLKAVIPNIINVDNEATLKIRQVVVFLSEEEKNVRFEISPVSFQPSKMPPGVPFSFIEINTNLSRNKLKNVKFTFRVEKTWINLNKIDISTISLYKWNETYWEKLNTSRLSEDSENVYFEASSPTLSIFVIAGERIKEKIPWFSILIIAIGFIVVGFILYLFWPTEIGTKFDKLKEKL